MVDFALDITEKVVGASGSALAIPDFDGPGPEEDFPGPYRAVAFSDSHVPLVDCAVRIPEKDREVRPCDARLADTDLCISDGDRRGPRTLRAHRSSP